MQAIKQAEGLGSGCTRDLLEVVEGVGRCCMVDLSTQFGWVKAHVGIYTNEGVDAMAKAGCRDSLLPQVTEGGIRVRWKAIHDGESVQVRLGVKCYEPSPAST